MSIDDLVRLRESYECFVGVEAKRYNPSDSNTVLDLDPNDRHDIQDVIFYIDCNTWIGDRIANRQNNPVFTQASILLVYFLAHHERCQLRTNWKGLQSDLQIVFTDLGIAFH